MNNPLLELSGLPLFDRIAPEHVAPALDALLAEAEQALDKVTADDFPPDWKAMSQALDVSTERLGMAWGAVSHLNSVADTPELRAAYNEALPKITEFFTRLGADELLYLDCVASLYGRNSLHELISRTADELHVPLTVGGGIRTLEDIREVLLAGADLVAINTAAIEEAEDVAATV